MNVLYLILFVLAAACFAAEALSVRVRYNLVALGLLLWVLVPLLKTVVAL